MGTNGVNLVRFTLPANKPKNKAEQFMLQGIRKRGKNVARNSFLDSTEFQIAREKIPNARHLFKFGYNSAIINANETIWDAGGIYTYPSSASQLTLTSTNAADAGLTVKVFGLDENWVEINETVTLDATDPSATGVTTTNTYIRVFRMYNNNGTDFTGNILAKIGATTHAQITAGENQTLMAVYSVPAGKTLYVTRGYISQGSSDTSAYITGRLALRTFGGVFRTQALVNVLNNTVEFDWEVPIRIPEKSDLEARAIVSKNHSVGVSATFEGVLVDGA